jgi:hypothetical protein
MVLFDDCGPPLSVRYDRRNRLMSYDLRSKLISNLILIVGSESKYEKINYMKIDGIRLMNG